MLRKDVRGHGEYRRIASTLQAREQELLRTNAQLEALLDNTNRRNEKSVGDSEAIANA
jgi:hypothetical protein